MGYLQTLRMKLPKPIKQTNQGFEIDKYNEMLDLIDTLAGITPVGSLALAPTTQLYDGRMIITRDTNNVYVYNFGLSIWQQANIQAPAQISTSQVAMLTTAQRSSLSRINLLDGTVIFNTTTNKLEIYNKLDFKWYDAVANVTFTTADPAVGGGQANVNFNILGTETSGASTSTATATAYGNQRKIDRTQNGVLWKVWVSGLSTLAARSTDNGATWVSDLSSAPANLGGAANYTMNGSFFIDIDDYGHYVYKNGSDGYIYYVRGTPNTARTAYTWSSALLVWNGDQNGDFADLIAHRDPAASGAWVVHVVFSRASGANNWMYYGRINIAANGSITTPIGFNAVSANYASSAHTFPSIDFRHNGDGKTIDTQPDIFMSFTAGKTGTGFGIRYIKGTYSAGNWTLGAEQNINAGTIVQNSAGWMQTMWDGTRIVVVGLDSSGGFHYIYERDLADTTTTQRMLLALQGNGSDWLAYGSSSYDASGNIYLFGNNVEAASGARIMGFRKWNRSDGVLAAKVNIDTTTDVPRVSCRRGYAGGRLDFIWTDGTASPYAIKYNNLTGVPPGVQGTLGPVVTITSSTSAIATAYGNQRKIDRCTNGVLWAIDTSADAPSATLYTSYSTDNGTTWNFSTRISNGSGSSTGAYTPNASLFIDVDDYAHIVMKDYANGYIYYVRGTPNAARTAYTWSAAVVLWDSQIYDVPDIVAFRDPAVSGGWAAAVVASRNTSSVGGKVIYWILKIAANGTVTGAGSSSANSLNADLATANGNIAYASIDFRHTGDGKTIATQPDLFVSWSNGATGAGYGIRFRKATYSAGSWTWGTEREIDANRYIINSATWLNCMWDGTRVIIAGGVRDFTLNDNITFMAERNLADDTTTPRVATTSGANYLAYGSCTYDASGNFYWLAQDAGGTNRLRKWTRSTTTLEAYINGPTSTGTPWFSLRRGYKNFAGSDQLDFVYIDGSASPYTVKAGKFT